VQQLAGFILAMVDAGDELWEHAQPVVQVHSAKACVEGRVHTGGFAVPEPHVEHTQHVLHHTGWMSGAAARGGH